MSKKTEKCLILGPSGSGKDHLLRKLSEMGMKPGLKWTTRPIRKYEKQGVTYNFVEKELFLEAIDQKKFLSYQKFDVTPENSDPETWYYGINIDDFFNSEVFIMTPGEFKELHPELRKKCFVVYLDISREIRERRIKGRNDKNDSVQRRLDADDIDFADLSDYDLRITDHEFDPKDVYEFIY